MSSSQFEGRPRSLNSPYFTKLPASNVGWKLQSFVLNSMPHRPNILHILSKNGAWRVRIISILLAALNPHILPMGWVPAFDTVPIAMYKYCEHSADLGVFLPLMEDAAIICCICIRNSGIYSIDQGLTSGLLADLLGLCSVYYRIFPRKLKINILWNCSVPCVTSVLVACHACCETHCWPQARIP